MDSEHRLVPSTSAKTHNINKIADKLIFDEVIHVGKCKKIQIMQNLNVL